jgi:hypothetical protein
MAGSFVRYGREPHRLSAIELHLLPKPRSPSQHNGLADKRQGLVASRDFLSAEDRFGVLLREDEGSDIVTLPAGDGSLRKWSWYFHDGAEGRG